MNFMFTFLLSLSLFLSRAGRVSKHSSRARLSVRGEDRNSVVRSTRGEADVHECWERKETEGNRSWVN